MAYCILYSNAAAKDRARLQELDPTPDGQCLSEEDVAKISPEHYQEIKAILGRNGKLIGVSPKQIGALFSREPEPEPAGGTFKTPSCSDIVILQEVFDALESLAKNPERSRVYLHFMLNALVDSAREAGGRLSAQPDVLMEAYGVLSEGAKAIAREYSIDELMSDPSEITLTKVDRKCAKKTRDERLSKISEEISSTIKAEPIGLNEYTEGGKTHYRFEMNVGGCRAEVTVMKVVDEQYGEYLMVTDLKVDGIDVKRVTHKLGSGLTENVIPAEEFRSFEGRLSDAGLMNSDPPVTVYYSAVLKMFFIGAKSESELAKLRAKGLEGVLIEESDDEIGKKIKYTFYSANGAKMFSRTDIEDRDSKSDYADMRVYTGAVYDGDGEEILNYREWIAKNGLENSEANKNRYIDEYLAPKLRDERMLNLFFGIKMLYTSDNIPANTQAFALLDMQDGGASGAPRIDRTTELHQPWDMTLDTDDREDAPGLYRGDCDDYGQIIRRVFESQGDQHVFALVIPQHITAISVIKNDDGTYTVKDMGTFRFKSYTAPTLAEAMQKMLDRYKETGLGVWQGRSLRIRGGAVTVEEVDYDRDQNVYRQYRYEVPLAALTDNELFEAVKDVEREMFVGRYDRAVALIDRYCAQYPDCRFLHKLKALSLAGARRKSEAMEAFKKYTGSGSPSSQDDYEFMINLTEGHEEQFQLLNLMIDSLDEIEYTDFVVKQVRLSPGEARRQALLDRMWPKVVDGDRKKFLNQLLTETTAGRSEPRYQKYLRAYLDILISEEGSSGISEKMVCDLWTSLPPEDQKYFAIRFLDKKPDDHNFSFMLLNSLRENKQYDLFKYLLEKSGLPAHMKALLRAKYYYYDLRDYAKAIASLEHNQLSTYSERSKYYDEMGSIMLNSFLRLDPSKGAVFYRSHVLSRSEEFRASPVGIIEGWMRCKYAGSPPTLANIASDYQALSSGGFTAVHRWQYLRNMFFYVSFEQDGRSYDEVPAQKDILVWIERELSILQEDLIARYAGKNIDMTDEEKDDPANEKTMLYYDNGTLKSCIQGDLNSIRAQIE